MSFSDRREFEMMRNAVGKMRGVQYQQIAEKMDDLKVSLLQIAGMSDKDPEYGKTLHAIEIQSDAVLKTVRSSGVRGIRIPQALHTFRTSLRQPDLVKQIAVQIAV